MKRGRPGFILSALAKPEHERAVAEAMLRETSTLGVRIAHSTGSSSTARASRSRSAGSRCA